ncbi:16S rRNA (guanine(966)-N(2))-methyltransferase RsmD [Neomoorella mulderi]|uniref:Ribosomal RNA small subunit methyltransferase D n=1 Tax=Moorella mulderi DSM 14980 TaxID=1122241 RepID=A0A151AYL2_9FIRM|nr:16S rRNA (guanine(966)-N(2))-methyltransferase RsmD [Moorella mulderi]KYH32497.1 ribosomal RNA small subunit methyltransferase D [Moorella mulderi DSM 14980]
MLRIIAGQARGRRLRTPKGRATRPTSDRVREALFNILGARVIDSLFLDLFAGSGAVGLEALSRGARKAVFVENDRQALACLAANLAATGFKDKAQIIAADARRALAHLAGRGLVFDLVFSDPPYYQGWGDVILPAVVPLLSPGGLVVLETAKSEAAPETADMVLMARRVYGDTALNFYQRAGGLADGVHDPD